MPIATLLSVVCFVSLLAKPDAPEVVDWQDAAKCVGRVCGIRGRVVTTENDGPSIRLYFNPDRRDARVILMRGWLVTWPSYEGQTIVATGTVDRFRDHVEVIVLDPREVAVLGPTGSPVADVSPVPTLAPSPAPNAAPTAAATAAPSPSPTQPASEVDELRQRVRELEERVRELEQH